MRIGILLLGFKGLKGCRLLQDKLPSWPNLIDSNKHDLYKVLTLFRFPCLSKAFNVFRITVCKREKKCSITFQPQVQIQQKTAIKDKRKKNDNI